MCAADERGGSRQSTEKRPPPRDMCITAAVRRGSVAGDDVVRVGGCTGRSEQRWTSRVQPGASVSPAPSTSPSPPFPLPSPSLPESPSPLPHSRHVLDEAEDGHEVPISHSPADERLHRDNRCSGKGGGWGEEISEAVGGWRRTSRG